MRVSRDLVDFLQGEVLGLCAGGEFLQPEVDGIRTEMKGRERRIRPACGSQ